MLTPYSGPHKKRAAASASSAVNGIVCYMVHAWCDLADLSVEASFSAHSHRKNNQQC